jgi:hypothetical protein
VADRIVDIICTVKIPAEDFNETVTDLLDEIESALRACRVTYQAPVIRNVTEVTGRG